MSHRALPSLFFFALTAIALGAGCRDSRGAPGGDVTDFYGLRVLPRFEVVLAPGAHEALEQKPREWVKATFRYRNDTWADVAVRLKGHRSMRGLDEKPSFKIKFDHFVKKQRFLGLRSLTLNAMVEDPTMMREALAYRLHRAVGVPAPETGYAELSVDGTPYGLYLLVETVDEEFVEDHFDGDEGPLYEGEYGCDLYPDDVAGFEKELGGEERRELAALATAATTSPPGALFGAEAARFDESALAFLAVSQLIGDFDGYRHSHNYRLYYRPAAGRAADPIAGRWFFIPWGLDRTFFKRLDPFDSNGLAARRCFGDPTCRRAYLRVLDRVVDRFAQLRLEQGVDVIGAFIARAEAADRRKPYSDAKTAKARARLRRFLRTRASDFTDELGCLAGDRERDRDGDGHACMDCDDADPAVHPGAVDVCGNQRDDDCSGLADDAPACPCPTVEAAGARFALCKLPMTWAAAGAFCTAQGGQLARLDSAEQSAIVYREAERLDDRSRWWIGLQDRAEEGRFAWVDGGPPAFLGWQRGQPDNGTCNQDCAALRRRGGGEWVDTHCGQFQPFVCRMP